MDDQQENTMTTLQILYGAAILIMLVMVFLTVRIFWLGRKMGSPKKKDIFFASVWKQLLFAISVILFMMFLGYHMGTH